MDYPRAERVIVKPNGNNHGARRGGSRGDHATAQLSQILHRNRASRSLAARAPVASGIDLDPQDKNLNIVIVDPSPVRAAILEEGLHEAGFKRVCLISDMQALARQIYAADPDVILIDLENPSRDVLEQMFQVSRAVRRPIAMFVDQSDSSMIQASVDAGVSAYIVDGLSKKRVRPILEMTISRFNAFATLQRELDDAKSALAERKVIDRAKGILMKHRQVDEETAYAMLRQAAMDQNCKLIEVARSVVSASDLLK